MEKTKRFLAVCSIAIVSLFIIGASCTAYAATGSVLISMSEFTIDGGTGSAPGDFYKTFNGGYLSGGASDPCFTASVHIPGNATKINKVVVYLTDTGSSSERPFFQLTGLSMGTGQIDNYCDANVTTGTSSVQPIQVPVLKHNLVPGRVYQLGACISNGQNLYGAKVVYTTP